MKKINALGFLLIALFLGACGTSNNADGELVLSGDQPPEVVVEIAGEQYETVLGSYCWNVQSTADEYSAECVDTVGPVGLLEDKDPIQIKAGEQVTLNMAYTPKPNKMYLSQMQADDEIEISISDKQFTAPEEKGLYYYSYGVWWMDEKDENVSLADAFYAFSLEVN